MLEYRDKELVGVGIGAMLAMKGNDPSYPMYLSGTDHEKGLHLPLYQKLGKDSDMQVMVGDLSDRIIDQSENTLDGKLDIEQIWASTQAKARLIEGDKQQMTLADNTNETNLMALQAMATLGNYQKMRDQKNAAKVCRPISARFGGWCPVGED